MSRSRFLTLAVAALGLAACGPFPGQPDAQPITGDQALRTHGHGIHAPAAETGMDLVLQLNTAWVVGGPTEIPCLPRNALAPTRSSRRVLRSGKSWRG